VATEHATDTRPDWLASDVAKLTIHDEAGCVICNMPELNARVNDHFGTQFSGPTTEALPDFPRRPSRLVHITPEDVQCAYWTVAELAGTYDIPAEY